MHVHVATSDGVAKFWPEPIIALASFYNVKTHELHGMEAIIKEHQDEFRAAWRHHFSE